jgi:hypothetical protein
MLYSVKGPNSAQIIPEPEAPQLACLAPWQTTAGSSGKELSMFSLRTLGAGLLGLVAFVGGVSAQNPTSFEPSSFFEGAPTPATAEPGGGRFVGGASLFLLRPYFQNNTAYSTVSGVGTNAALVATQSFDWDFSASPAIWAGYEAENGLGFRGRAFYFDQSSQNSQTSLTAAEAAKGFILPPADLLRLPGAAFGAPGVLTTAGFGADQLEFGSNLRVETYDAEVTYGLHRDALAVEFSAGGRYLHMSQGYVGHLTNGFTDPATGLRSTEEQTLTFGHDFTGGGPTLATQLNAALCGSGLSVFGSARGSLLVGHTSQSLSLGHTVTDPAGLAGGSFAINPRSVGRGDHTMPVFEAEAGFEYRLMLGQFLTLARASVVSQSYIDAGNASTTQGTLGLFGAQVSLGLSY